MKGLFKAIVVDDERLARVELSKLLVATGMVSVVGHADTIEAAAEEIRCKHPDVVFLDIQLGKESGFDLLNRVGGFKVIFVTAYDQYAIRAFEYHALDYLLKPVNPERLAEAVHHLTQRLKENAGTNIENREFICVKTSRTLQFVDTKSIVCILASGDYTEVHTEGGKKLFVLAPLKHWEQRLDQRNFARIHRSTIVNLEYVDRVRHTLAGGLRIQFKVPQPDLSISRRFASRLWMKQRLV